MHGRHLSWIGSLWDRRRPLTGKYHPRVQTRCGLDQFKVMLDHKIAWIELRRWGAGLRELAGMLLKPACRLPLEVVHVVQVALLTDDHAQSVSGAVNMLYVLAL